MRGREMLDAIENLNPAYIEAAAETPKAKKAGWLKWGAMAACLCLVVAGSLMFFSSEDPGGDVGQDLVLYELTLVGDDLYFTDQDGGVFRYSVGAEKPEKLASFRGTLIQTTSGLYCTDYQARAFYRIAGTELQKLIEVDSGELTPWFIDVVENYVYWCTSDYVEGNDGDRFTEVMIYRTDITTEETEFLFTEPVSIHRPEYISQGRIYYETYRGVVMYFDIASGSTHILNDELDFSERDIQVRSRFYYDDCMIFHVDETLYDKAGARMGMVLSLYRMPYDEGPVVKLTDIAPESCDPVRVGDELFYTAMFKTETGGRLAFVSCDIHTGEVVELTEYPEDLSNMAFELAVHEDGIYVTNPSYSNGGIYFYSHSSGETKLIYK